MISEDVGREVAIAEEAAGPRPGRVWPAFIVGALVLYAALYGWSEYLVYTHGEKSRTFMIATAPMKHYDMVILGASHAMPLGFGDMNETLEKAAGASIINLSIEGGGLVPNRAILDYYLAHHDTKNVVYVLDSFAFYSRQWNEERINDPKLIKRAPLDPALAMTLWHYPSARELIPGYVSGFTKINNADRFERDVGDNEAKNFDRVYKPSPMIDRQRLAYLYPKTIDQTLLDGYYAMFDAFAADLHQRGIKLIVVRTPLPNRVLSKLRGEADFNEHIQAILAKYDAPFHDYSAVGNDDAFYYDSDHLNRAGVTNLVGTQLGDALKADKQ